jgi:release factor glutamine methyltransferase
LLLREAATRLASSESARLDSELLLLHALRRERAWLYANPDYCPTETEQQAFLELIARRAMGEPVAYLTGTRAFWTLDLAITPDVLIPRPETELLVELALRFLRNVASPRVIDLGTGSGAIALAIASERPDAEVIATDISPAAIDLASTNARRHGIHNVRFVVASWFGDEGGEFNAVLSNPPYVEADDPHLQQGDCRFEPRIALTPGGDGLAAIREICMEAASRLRPGGLLAFEHGWNQGEMARKCLEDAGLAGVETCLDLAGLERVTLGSKAP